MNLNSEQKKFLTSYLSRFVTSHKLGKFEEVLENRTRHLTVVLEDIYQTHNASAVLRSCDAFGIQDVHIIENRNSFRVNPDVTIGANKWLTLHRYKMRDQNNTQTCFEGLKRKGYTLIATTPHEDGFDLEDLPIQKKTALVFGTERIGLSETALKNVDGYMKIPMRGFSESFNISVCVAVCLYHLTSKVRNLQIDWKLSEEERSDLLFEWVQKNLRNPETLIKRAWDENFSQLERTPSISGSHSPGSQRGENPSDLHPATS